MFAATRGEKLFWVVLGLAAVAVAGVVLLTVTTVWYIQSSWEVLAAAHRDFAGLEQKQNEIITAEQALAGLARERELIRASFVDPAHPLPFIESIEGLGRRLGVEVELAVVPGREELGGQEYTLTARGSLAGTASLLRSLESLPFLIHFGDIALTTAGAAPATVTGEKQGKKVVAPEVELTLTIHPVPLPAGTRP